MSAVPSTPPEDDKKLAFEHIEGHHEQQLHHAEAPEAHLGEGPVDQAAHILAEAGKVEFSEEDDRRVLRLIDFWVLTPMVIIYILQQMDKSSVSYSSLFGIIADTHLVGVEYSWLGSVVYVAQLFCQPLSSYALVKWPVKKWLCFNVLCWGIVVACSAAATNFAGLITARLLLGIFEATLAPTFIALCQMWWRRREQTWRVVAWNLANTIAGIIGPLIAYGIGRASKSVKPYQGIFLFLGCITIACVPLIWYMMPDSPTTARFLEKGNDRAIAVERLRDNNMGSAGSRVWKWDQAKEAFLDIKTWGWAVMLFCCACPSGGISSFGGLLIAGLGFANLDALLLSIPPAAIGMIVLLTATTITTKIQLRAPVIACLTLFPIGGAIAMRLVPHTQVNARLGCYYIVNFFQALQPSVYAWATLNTAGQTKKTVTTAVFFVAQCVGNIVGPQVYLIREKPNYFTGIEVDIACWSILCITTILMALHMKRLNIKQARRREALGRVGNKLDTSIMTSKHAAEYKEQLKRDNEESGHVEELNAHAFEDLTDFGNADFVYCI